MTEHINMDTFSTSMNINMKDVGMTPFIFIFIEHRSTDESIQIA
jgi:hypothetical protein